LFHKEIIVYIEKAQFLTLLHPMKTRFLSGRSLLPLFLQNQMKHLKGKSETKQENPAQPT
jgi:hypothetical protein